MKPTQLMAALAVALCSTAAYADPITYELADVTAKLHDAPCKNLKVQEMLRAPDQFRAADVTWQGQGLGACWAVVGSDVMLIDETGDSGYLPKEGFRNGSIPVALLPST